MKRKKVGCLVLLLVAGVGVILVWSIMPGALFKSRAISVASCGRQIHLAVFAESHENSDPIWPVVGQYKTSTEFFRSLVSNNIIPGIDFSFFGAPGVSPPKDLTDPEKFTSENNAWCVVLLPNDGLSRGDHNIPATTPFLFTKNMGFGSPPGLPKTGDTIADMSGLRKGVKPFGNKLGIVVTFGGAVKIIPYDYITQENFNPTGESLQFLMP